MTDFADEIKSTVSMQAVCDQYGIPVNRLHKAPCPFHSDKKPSMHVYPGRRGWYCYVCGEGGSVIDFTMKLFGLDFIDTVRKMNDDFSVGLDIDKKLSDDQKREAAKIAERRRRERQAHENRLKQLCTAYDAAMDYYAALDVIIQQDAPEGPYDDVSPQYAYALRHVDSAWERVQEAAEAIRKFKEEGDE